MSNKANWTVGRMGPRQKAKARARLEQVCASCGSGENLTLDHKVARAYGGTNGIGNPRKHCERCSFAKSSVEQQVLAAALTRRTTTFAEEQ